MEKRHVVRPVDSVRRFGAGGILGGILGGVGAIAIWTGPAAAETPPTTDAFGIEITLPEKTIVYLTGTGTWDTAYETLVEALRTVHEYVDRRGLKPDGDAMMIYTGADDTGFDYKAAVPVMGTVRQSAQGRSRGRSGADRQGLQIRPSRRL